MATLRAFARRSVWAMALPMPLAAPVTMQTLSFSFMRFLSCAMDGQRLQPDRSPARSKVTISSARQACGRVQLGMVERVAAASALPVAQCSFTVMRARIRSPWNWSRKPRGRLIRCMIATAPSAPAVQQIAQVGIVPQFRRAACRQPLGGRAQLLQLRATGRCPAACGWKSGCPSRAGRRRPWSRGTVPREVNRSTWKTVISQGARLSSTYCSGVLETRPPSQYHSPSISTGGKPGGRAPLAMICSGPICALGRLSK